MTHGVIRDVKSKDNYTNESHSKRDISDLRLIKVIFTNKFFWLFMMMLTCN